jgi:hypothetical protein
VRQVHNGLTIRRLRKTWLKVLKVFQAEGELDYWLSVSLYDRGRLLFLLLLIGWTEPFPSGLSVSRENYVLRTTLHISPTE